jgi:hypothetical protein
MKPEDIQNAPKLFCEDVTIAGTKEFFVFALRSGNQATIYSLTPELAKRLSQHLAYRVGEYEKQHGTIDATWSPHVVSPVQKLNPPTELS